MKVVILAGGFGTRISEESHLKPKPMIEIGEKPILWHIMKEYSAYGINEFIICAGYKQHVIKEWFADYFIHTSDITFDFTKGNEMIIHNKHAEPWKVTVVDTGLNTQTGGRIKRVKDFVGDDTFMVIHIYIMDNHISDINKNKLIEVVKEYRRDISFVPMPDMKELTGQEIDTRRWNISTFGRLYMASALPKTVHKVLNIDCDTIIVDTIEPLWNTDMTGKVFGGMLECINDRYRRNVGKNDGDYYLNGGIVFLNLDEVRVGNYERKFTDYITKYGSSLAYLDQDVLNGVVEQEKKVKLPMRYNALSIYFYATYEQVLKIRRSKSQDFYSKEEFSEAISNPGLVHFTTCFLDGLRPWIKGNQHPYLKTFLKYKEMSPWRDIPLQEDKRSGLVKFRTTMIRKAPRFVLCEVASVLHGVIIPEKNYKRMQERVKE